MQFVIEGDCETAARTRVLMASAGLVVADKPPTNPLTPWYQITITEADVAHISLDSVDSLLESSIHRFITEQTSAPVLIDRAGGVVHSDKEIGIVVPRSQEQREAVALGVMRGVLSSVKMLPKRKRWWLFGVLLAFSVTAQAQQQPTGQQPLKVNCVAGCSGGGAVNQGTANTQANRWPVFLSNGTIEWGPVTNPFGVRLSDGSAFYDAAKSSQFPAALDGSGFLKVHEQGTATTDPSDRDARILGRVKIHDGTDSALVSGSGSLQVTCDNCGGSTFADNGAFTFGTSPIVNIGAVVDDTATNAVTENGAGNPRMSASRVLYGNLRNAGGTEVVTATTTPGASDLGLVVRNIPSGTQPVSGTVTANAGTGPFPVSDNGGSLTVDGAVTANPRTAGTSAVTSVAGSASSVTLLVSNANRLGATVYNDSTAILYVKLGATASTTSFTLKVFPEGYVEIPAYYTGVIDGIWASATGSARITELSA